MARFCLDCVYFLQGIDFLLFCAVFSAIFCVLMGVTEPRKLGSASSKGQSFSDPVFLSSGIRYSLVFWLNLWAEEKGVR
jgi:hypothetical protein